MPYLEGIGIYPGLDLDARSQRHRVAVGAHAHTARPSTAGKLISLSSNGSVASGNSWAPGQDPSRIFVATPLQPSVQLFQIASRKRHPVANGLGSVQISNPAKDGPHAALALDEKGAHVKFDRLGGASSYLFLNNRGESGAVFLDPGGRRRLSLLIKSNGESAIERFDDQGHSIP